MGCFVLSDKTGVSSSLTDKDLIEYLIDLRNADDGSWEVQERELFESGGFFFKDVIHKHYQLYSGTQRGEWQVITCAGGVGEIGKAAVIAYIIGRVGGLQDGRKK